MSFRIQLDVRDDLIEVPRSLDLEPPIAGLLSPHDLVVHVLAAQCRALARSRGVSFRVSGFGDDRWPVDVETDLAVMLEQLPTASSRLLARQPFELNFFEQGIERYLTGTPSDEVVRFECVSMLPHWSPSPPVEVVSLADTERMFCEVRSRYELAVERTCPWLARIAIE